MVGAGDGRSDSGGRRQGLLVLDAGGQALPRLQQPVDVRQHRARRRARHRARFSSRPRRSPTPTRSWPPSRGPGSAASWPRSRPGDIDVFFFTLGGAEANENAIKIARQYTGRHKILVLLPLVSRRHRRQHDADRRSAALGVRAGNGRRRPCAEPVSRHPARVGQRRRRRSRRSKRRSSSKGRTRSRPSSWSRSPAPTASSCRLMVISRASASCARSTES